LQLELFKGKDNTDIEEEKEKECYVCNKTKPWTKQYFGIGVSCKSGVVHLKGICKDCDNEASVVRNILRAKHIKDLKDTCDCCGRHVSKTKRGFHLDHCYKTGVFRGWLCPQCNRGLGNFGENVNGLEKAIKYLNTER